MEELVNQILSLPSPDFLTRDEWNITEYIIQKLKEDKKELTAKNFQEKLVSEQKEDAKLNFNPSHAKQFINNLDAYLLALSNLSKDLANWYDQINETWSFVTEKQAAADNLVPLVIQLLPKNKLNKDIKNKLEKAVETVSRIFPFGKINYILVTIFSSVTQQMKEEEEKKKKPSIVIKKDDDEVTDNEWFVRVEKDIRRQDEIKILADNCIACLNHFGSIIEEKIKKIDPNSYTYYFTDKKNNEKKHEIFSQILADSANKNLAFVSSSEILDLLYRHLLTLDLYQSFVRYENKLTDFFKEGLKKPFKRKNKKDLSIPEQLSIETLEEFHLKFETHKEELLKDNSFLVIKFVKVVGSTLFLDKLYSLLPIASAPSKEEKFSETVSMFSQRSKGEIPKDTTQNNNANSSFFKKLISFR
ncbi:MAG: hypothetical protein ACD_46C00568G0003 [uncultured bacterium]|nr:MAG: hypothetical protein ACD_46C00568G0003 [uncultured bacterium]